MSKQTDLKFEILVGLGLILFHRMRPTLSLGEIFGMTIIKQNHLLISFTIELWQNLWLCPFKANGMPSQQVTNPIDI